jgi:protein O-mannosyl-transferase
VDHFRTIVAFFRKHPVAVAIGCASLSYITSFFGIFHFDDFGTVVNYLPSHSFDAWWHGIASGRRALLKLSYVINWNSGAGLAGFHAVNLAIHCAVVAAVYYLVKLAQPSRANAASGWGAPFIAAVLFAAHPIHSEAVTYISGRSSSLMTLFYCAGLLCYVYGARSRSRICTWLYSPALFAAACFVKETAITFPLALLLWEWCFERDSWKIVLKRQWVHWTILGVLSCGVLLHPAYFTLMADSVGTRSVIQMVHANIRDTLHLLAKLVMFNRLSIDPNPVAAGSVSPFMWVEFVGLAGLCIAALLYAKKWPRAVFGICWVVLQVFLVYSLFPRADVLNERHMYLSDVGLFLGLGAGIEMWYLRPNRMKTLAFAVLISLLMVFTNLRSLDYRNSIALWESTVRVSPLNSRAWNNLGLAYERKHLFYDSKNAYIQAIAVDSTNGVARNNLNRVTLRIQYSTNGD